MALLVAPWLVAAHRAAIARVTDDLRVSAQSCSESNFRAEHASEGATP